MPENNEATQKDDGLPDSEICRAKNHGSRNAELVVCLIEHPLCNFSLLFGSSLLLCQHPRRKEIIERTKAILDDSAEST